MPIAMRGVEFSFNNKMYQQLGGVAMGSPFGPALANIFVGFHEGWLFDNTTKSDVYSFHPALKFTVQKEQNNSLISQDVSVE